MVSKTELALALADEIIIIGILLFAGITALAYFGAVELWAAVAIAAIALLIVGAFVYISFKPQLSKPKVGMEAMLGKKGTATSKIAKSGMVLIDGEYWRAKSEETIEKDEAVEVTGIDGLMLKVKKSNSQ
ncbi:MAG: NfeD family protein [Candidatus Methanomethylicia archaeon]|nr:NfeD family protein [Candidatus Methanomethylicia archaeon]